MCGQVYSLRGGFAQRGESNTAELIDAVGKAAATVRPSC